MSDQDHLATPCARSLVGRLQPNGYAPVDGVKEPAAPSLHYIRVPEDRTCCKFTPPHFLIRSSSSSLPHPQHGTCAWHATCRLTPHARRTCACTHAATCAACRMCQRMSHVPRAGTCHMRVPHAALSFTSNFTLSCNSTHVKKHSHAKRIPGASMR